MTDVFTERRREIEVRIEGTTALIEAARRGCSAGAIVDLQDLERCVRELCAMVKAAPRHEVAGLGERIIPLRDELQTLGDALAVSFQALIGGAEAARRRPAIDAYGKTGGDG